MATYKRPGVYVEESLLQTDPEVFSSITIAAFIGVASRGPAVIGGGYPTLISSWTQYVRLFGGFTGADQSLAHAVYQFYNNGGSLAYIVRAVGTGAVSATRSLMDRAGTPVALLKVDAANPGGWGNLLYVNVTDVGITGRFNLEVKLGGSGDQYIVERWTDLSMDQTDSRYAVALINSPFSGSIYITTTNLQPNASYVAATVVPALSSGGGDVLTTGADGAAPSVGGAGQVFAAISSLAVVDDFLTINVPGVTDSATVNAAIAFAESRGTAFVVIDCAANNTPAQAITLATGYTSTSYAAVYYPQIVIADPSNTVPGSTRKIPPGAAVIGQYVRTDTQRGVHKAPAGVKTKLNGVVALEVKPLDTEADSLNQGKVNLIKQLPGIGPCIYGARTLKINQIDKYVNVRRTLISLRMQLTEATRYAVFESNDERLWSQLTSTCSRILLELWQEGGLRGVTASQAFYVKCDSDTNPQNDINNGQVHIEIGCALEVPAEFIVLRIGQFESGTTINEEV